jgi:glycolate oxidase FAD binding subunit
MVTPHASRRSPFERKTTRMTETLKPRDAKDVEDAVQWALGGGKPLEIVGHGSKRALGRPAQADLTLDLSGLTGVTLYEPEELVLSARAGTPLAEIEALVASKGQQLAFEPMDYAAILGATPGRGTIGGAIAANLSGPRRIKAGAARDHFLGFSAVSGRGETFKSGGRVVKNVTGYDLCKLMAGSWGTLAALIEVTIKVLPKPETEATLLVMGLDDAAGGKAMSVAMGSPCEVSGAAHLPAAIASRASEAGGKRAITALRLEGVAPSIAHRRQVLDALMKPFGPVAVLDEAASAALWRGIRDVTPLASDGSSDQRPLWRISTAPTKGAELARLAAGSGGEMLYDWAGGLVWLAVPPSDDAGAATVRRAVAACGGHATLVRAPAALRAAVGAFEPQDAALAALTKRVKEGFDPKGVLNPGRMWTGV